MKRPSRLKARLPTDCAACPVRALALFQPYGDDEVALVQQYKSEHRVVPPGTDIYQEGEPCQELYTLFDGWIFLYKRLENGRRQILKFLLPGDFLGFQSHLGQGREHCAQSLTDAALCVFPRRNLLTMFSKHPELGIRLTWITAHDLALSHEHLTVLGRRSARERLAHLMVELFYRLVEREDGWLTDNTIPFPLTQHHMADALGLTPIHVNRTLKELRAAGLVELGRRKLHIPSPERLAVEAGFSYRGFAMRPML